MRLVARFRPELPVNAGVCRVASVPGGVHRGEGLAETVHFGVVCTVRPVSVISQTGSHRGEQALVSYFLSWDDCYRIFAEVWVYLAESSVQPVAPLAVSNLSPWRDRYMFRLLAP